MDHALMRRFAWSLVAVILVCVVSARAQILSPILNDQNHVAAGYTGPCDAISCSGIVSFYSFRCITAAYSGNVADVWDTATGVTTETKITCSGGTLVTSSPNPLATTCAVGCSVHTIYDQSAAAACATSVACDVTKAAPSWAVFTQNCPSTGLFCSTWSGTQSLESANALTSTVTQPLSVSMVAERTGNTGAFNTVIANTNSNPQTGFGNSVNTVLIYAGTVVTEAANDNALHSLEVLYNGASSKAMTDGSLVTGISAGAGTFSGKIDVGHAAGSNGLSGLFMEAIVFSGDKSASFAALHTNQSIYWCAGAC